MKKRSNGGTPPKRTLQAILAKRCCLWIDVWRCKGCDLYEECTRYRPLIKKMKNDREKAKASEIDEARHSKNHLRNYTEFWPNTSQAVCKTEDDSSAPEGSDSKVDSISNHWGFRVNYDDKHIGYLFPLDEDEFKRGQTCYSFYLITEDGVKHPVNLKAVPDKYLGDVDSGLSAEFSGYPIFPLTYDGYFIAHLIPVGEDDSYYVYYLTYGNGDLHEVAVCDDPEWIKEI